MPGFAKFLLFVLLVAAGAFGFAEAPPDTPTPQPDPVTWLIGHPERWPKQVTLVERQDFPAMLNGKLVGAISVPAGSVVTVVKIEPEAMTVVFRGGEKRISYKATNLAEIAKAEMERPVPAPTPELANAAPIVPPAPTPFRGFEENREAEKEPPADHVVSFETNAPGEDKAIRDWGLDTCWPEINNMKRGLIFMGPENVNIVRVGFDVGEPLKNGELTEKQKAAVKNFASIAALAGPKARWDMNLASEVNAWYIKGQNRVHVDRWAAAMVACQKAYNRPMWMVEPFNEPDYLSNNEGSPEDLRSIMNRLLKSSLAGAKMAGGSTLNNDEALPWYKTISSQAAIGTTHCLAGTAKTYVDFLKAVARDNKVPFNPELHNNVEVLMGAEYGMKGGIWWGTAELARGELVKACQGRRLGYAEDLPKWTAAAVYRAPSGKLQAFVGASERMAVTTTYRFSCKDRNVFFDGHGPQREYTVTIPGGNGYWKDQPNAEVVINITWGADVPPPIAGKYILVNRNSGKVMEVADAGKNEGAVIQQGSYAGKTNQQWDVTPLDSRNGGDYSYYTIKAVHSGMPAEVANFSYDDGGPVQQWSDTKVPTQNWFLEYAGDNCFYVRNRWNAMCLDVADKSAAGGARLVQSALTDARHQQWRLVPVSDSPLDSAPPAEPSLLTASAQAGSIELKWTANKEPDLAGYTVLRADKPGGPYDTIARGVTTNQFVDKSANEQRRYYYVVRAVDRSMNQSKLSMETSALPASGGGVGRP